MDLSIPKIQIFIQFPSLNLRSRTLVLNPNETIHNLKQYLIPRSISSKIIESLYLTFRGKILNDLCTISESNIGQFSIVDLHVRAIGGGGDGGATGAESRDCYLNMYATKKPDKVDSNEMRLSKWTTCSLSFEPLKHPIVADQLGNVFNKEALVAGLLGKKLPKEFGHIKGLNGMIPIQLSEIPGIKDEETQFQCPITGLEFNGKYRFLALKGCGHVLSVKALKEVKSSACLICHMAYTEADKIAINGSEEEVAALRERMEEGRSKLKDKKMKKVKSVEVSVNGKDGLNFESANLIGVKHHGIDNNNKSSETVSVSNPKIENGRVGVKATSNGPSAKRFKATDVAPANATKEVYASIFTSSNNSTFKETYSCRSLPIGRN